jgi:hemolysin activation/secretion protein
MTKRLWAACRAGLIALLGLTVWTGACLAQDAQAFDVFEYRVEGTTLLPVIQVEKAVYPHLGEKKTLADVEQARGALEAAYHSAGYLTVVVSIPEQKVDGGVVKLQVTEAPVGRLRVVGSRYFSLGDIKAAAPELSEGQVPNFPQMQTELAALNRSADRRITPVLRPGKTPGTVEVDLKVEDELPLHGSLDVNNRYSQDTTPTRVGASLRYDNLWDRQHSLGLTLQGVPENPNESRVLSMNYSWPLASGNYLAFYGVKSESDVAAVGTLNVVGKGTILGARYILPLRAQDDFFQTATLGVDHKDFSQAVNLIGSGGFNTPITYMPFTLGWDGSWLDGARSTRLGVAFNFHLRGLVGDEQEFADKRFKGRPGYAYLRGTALQTYTLPSGWGASARMSWQLSPQPLISNEQFTIGGVDTVRGYLESAASGDTGLALSLEASTPNWANRVSDTLDEVRLLAFVDGGKVKVLSPITADEYYNLVGAGLGLRVKGWRGASATLDWALAMQDLAGTRQGDSRVYFKLGYEW